MRLIRRIPSYLSLVLVAIVAGGIFLVGFVVAQEGFTAFKASGYLENKANIERMGQQGDFIGGHLSAVFSAATLAMVIFTTFLQSRASNLAEARRMFASAIDAISKYDTHRLGCPQALRLLNHYSGLALRYDRGEFYSLLHTVMTSKMRRALRKSRSPYQNAVRVRHLISGNIARTQLRKRFGWLEGSARYYTRRYKRP